MTTLLRRAMNKKQKVLTIVALVVLVILAARYCSASHSYSDPNTGNSINTGPNSEDLGIFFVSSLVLGVTYSGLFFVFKK
jgi:hypothetical protein